jgi:heptaprenyl diphosphate synthase
MATLVHDDVIDSAPVRRNIETLNVKFGNREAVICGDYLLCLALGVISDIAFDDYSKYANLIPSMTKTISKICEGECRQIFENKNTGLSFSNYLRIITGKTACLFYLSAYAGAVIGGCDEKETKSLACFGQNLGMLFQITDDIKDYEQSEDQAKKPVKHDITEGSVTLPLIIALRKNQSLARFAAEIMQNGKDPAPLVYEVIKTGAIDDSKAIAERYRVKAKKNIESISNEDKRKSLIRILEQI